MAANFPEKKNVEAAPSKGKKDADVKNAVRSY